jgi:hypothetical protein
VKVVIEDVVVTGWPVAAGEKNDEVVDDPSAKEGAAEEVDEYRPCMPVAAVPIDDDAGKAPVAKGDDDGGGGPGVPIDGVAHGGCRPLLAGSVEDRNGLGEEENGEPPLGVGPRLAAPVNVATFVGADTGGNEFASEAPKLDDG